MPQDLLLWSKQCCKTCYLKANNATRLITLQQTMSQDWLLVSSDKERRNHFFHSWWSLVSSTIMSIFISLSNKTCSIHSKHIWLILVHFPQSFVNTVICHPYVHNNLCIYISDSNIKRLTCTQIILLKQKTHKSSGTFFFCFKIIETVTTKMRISMQIHYCKIMTILHLRKNQN